MGRSSDWPIGDTLRLPARRAPEARRRGLPRVTWVLAIAAFVCGALLSAAAFSVGWRHQAQRGSSAEAALAAVTAKNHGLAASLGAARAAAAQSRAQAAQSRAQATRSRAQAAAALAAKASAAAAASAVSREASSLAEALVASGRSADSVSVGAASLGTDLDRLTSELKTLTSYLDSTPTSQLDPGYVRSQTAYLAKQLDRIGSERSDLGAAIATFDAGVKKLAGRASTLSGRN